MTQILVLANYGCPSMATIDRMAPFLTVAQVVIGANGIVGDMRATRRWIAVVLGAIDSVFAQVASLLVDTPHGKQTGIDSA